MTKILITFFTLITIVFPQQIILDEDFSDWTDDMLVYSDSLDDNQSSINFGKLYVNDDEEFIYFLLEVGAEINLQDNNSINLFIDTDNNSSTGLSKDGIGVDFQFTFGERRGKYYFSNGSSVNVFHDDIELINSPTVTSDRFEFCIYKSSVISGNILFPSDNIKIIVEDTGSDRLPDLGSVDYTMKKNLIEYKSYSISKLNEDHLRILSYNVERDSPFDNNKKVYFERIIKAVNPDVIGFQEIYDHSAAEVKNFVQSILPNETWYSSNAVPDIIVVSKFPVKKSAQTDGNGIFLLDLRPKYDSDLFFISAHPPCCTNDIERQEEIDAFMAFLRDSKNGTSSIPIEENTPIVIVGDMNLVGLKRQQTTLITGDIFYNGIYGVDFNPDWDETALADSKPITTNTNTTFTWFSESSSFFPGRLDYVVYSNSVLEKENGFSLFTRALPADSLTKYNLQKEDVVNASDHLPLVVDFSFKNAVSANEKEEIPTEFGLKQNFPNPFNPNTTIEYSIPKNVGTTHELSTLVSLKVYDVLGNEIATLVNETKQPGSYKVNFDAHGFPSGVYIYKLNTAGHSQVRKMMLLK
ncbi:MAG: endonuclease/exonuclease/phosphatase family protein [Melioribacteraceae bacterium]|nr:endonuclease/exonuclease/phosphatase family protein [Melioribacteraceae bacterium]